MDLHDIDKMLEGCKTIKAPPDFTRQVMARVHEIETKEAGVGTTLIKTTYYQWGISCLAASILMLLLNLYPASHLFKQADFNYQPQREASIVSLDFVPDIVDSFTIKTNQVFSNPIKSFVNAFRKEE